LGNHSRTNGSTSPYKRHRFPPAIIQYSVGLYYRFDLSHRDIEDLLARQGALVIHESIRLGCGKFGPQYAHRLRRGHLGYGDSLLMDDVFVRIRGQQRYLWRAVDQDGEVLDALPQERRDSAAARRFFRHLLTRLGGEPRTIATDKLGSHAVARRKPLLGAMYGTRWYPTHRAELPHRPTRIRERGMRRFKSILQAQRFVGVHADVSNLFNLGRHLVAAGNQRTLRQATFASQDLAVAV
jgi:putative transposase